MNSVVRGVIAGLMLLGLISAAAMPKAPKANTTLMVAGGGGPAPLCDPTANPNCPPVIPTN